VFTGFFDGSANPNPGETGLGICLFNRGHEVFCGARPGGHGTNNEAEYNALIWLLEECIKINVKEIVCYGDSQLVVNQVSGHWCASKQRLQDSVEHIQSLIKAFKAFDIKWLPREKNSRADTLSKRGVRLKEANMHFADTARCENGNVVPIDKQTSPSALVMPMIKDEFVILEGSIPVYINTNTGVCSCSEFTSSGSCRHSRALLKAKRITLA